MLPSEKECRDLAARALGFAGAPDASVVFVFEHEGHTRFANNQITTAGARESVRAVVSVTLDGRTGQIETGDVGDEALKDAFWRAEAQAALLPPNPEYVGPLAAQRYREVAAYDEATAALDAAGRLPGVRAAVSPAAAERMKASGFTTDERRVQCIANKAGNFGYFRSTESSFSATVRTADGTGSGWAERASHRVEDLHPELLAKTALRKGSESAKPQPIEPGDYTVILESAAVAGLLGSGFGQAFSARAVEEGRSYFSRKGGGTMLGEKLFHESVTLKTDPTDPRRPTVPWSTGGGFGGGGRTIQFDQEYGLSVEPIVWIERGELRNLWYDRYWAKKAEREPIPAASNLILEGGTDTLESLIASTDRGLLITNFHYIRTVNQQSLQLTGLTRDGVWLVEKGKIVRPVVNLRFNESPAVLLQNLVGMTPAERGTTRVTPAVKATEFTFSSLSDAV